MRSTRPPIAVTRAASSVARVARAVRSTSLFFTSTPGGECALLERGEQHILVLRNREAVANQLYLWASVSSPWRVFPLSGGSGLFRWARSFPRPAWLLPLAAGAAFSATVFRAGFAASASLAVPGLVLVFLPLRQWRLVWPGLRRRGGRVLASSAAGLTAASCSFCAPPWHNVENHHSSRFRAAACRSKPA